MNTLETIKKQCQLLRLGAVTPGVEQLADSAASEGAYSGIYFTTVPAESLPRFRWKGYQRSEGNLSKYSA
ncbi:hypothetical protein GALL_412300 [mine drainage metagenome]|uniref:Uncharacterized protein n=1 Tax=mine drainage metagenome TaxID=410659 RepID=A0A1J5Q176_9ZZZZ